MVPLHSQFANVSSKLETTFLPITQLCNEGLGSNVLRILNGNQSHTTSSSMDQAALTAFQLGQISECLEEKAFGIWWWSLRTHRFFLLDEEFWMKFGIELVEMIWVMSRKTCESLGCGHWPLQIRFLLDGFSWTWHSDAMSGHPQLLTLIPYDASKHPFPASPGGH